MINKSYEPILNLLMAYEQQLTLSKDEFDAVDFYQQLGYRLHISDPFDDAFLMPDAPAGCVAYRMVIQDSHWCAYYLVKGGE